jgi:hypothetical protein
VRGTFTCDGNSVEEWWAMMLSWPGMPAAWGYALTVTGMMLFWILVIFGAIVLVHRFAGGNRPAAAPIGCSPDGSAAATSVPPRSTPSPGPGLRDDLPAGLRGTAAHPPSDGPLRRPVLHLLTEQ